MVDIVYIDDEPALLRSISMLLEFDGFSVEAFSSPREGIDFINRNEVGLVLCDYRMPELSGLQVLEAIESDVNFYLFSGDLNLVNEDSRVAGVFSKPIAAEKLSEAMRRALGRPAGA